MNITPKLSLNKHPKDSDNLSLVNAQAVKISNDESCIVNENSIKENQFIHIYLGNYYGQTHPYKVVGIIPCNNELVIIVKPNNTVTDADIFRYREGINDNIEAMYAVYGGLNSSNRFTYQGGKIKGAFTYNVEDSLIVAITEYDATNIRIPLRTINLGHFYDSSVHSDKALPNSKLSISPELRVPLVKDLDYIPGSAYKGWYYMFIRYKVNTIDYTQWHSIGTPIYIDTIEKYQILRYAYNRETRLAVTGPQVITSPSMPDDGFGAGFSDHFSNNSDIAKETFKVDLHFDNRIKYDKYQIGVMCNSKSYSKAFRSADISIDNNSQTTGINTIQQYVLDNKSLIDYNVVDLITDNFNYFNVKNIWNYKNRLYISNYSENNANNDDIPQSFINDINVTLGQSGVRDFGLVYDTAIMSNGLREVNQYDTYAMTSIPLHEYLNVSKDTMVYVYSPAKTGMTAKAGNIAITSQGTVGNYIAVDVRTKDGTGAVVHNVYTGVNITLRLADQEGKLIENIQLNGAGVVLNGGMRYMNTNKSFKDRKINSSLIPGEIYKFYIHYVDKYNHATNGYPLSNKTIWQCQDAPGVEIIPIPFIHVNGIGAGAISTTYYAAMPVNSNVAVVDSESSSGYNVNIQDIKIYANYNAFLTQPTLVSKVSSAAELYLKPAFIEYFNNYAGSKFLDTKWYQISYGPGEVKFHLFINDNGDRLFKVPIPTNFTQGWENFPGEFEDFRTFNFLTTYNIGVNNIQIPQGYEGYYISYEKFEAQARVTGLLTRNDFRSQDYMVVGGEQVPLGTANNLKADTMYFYSGQFDIADSLKMDYNIFRIEAVNNFKKTDINPWDYFQRNGGFNYLHDMNKPQVDLHGGDIQRTYPMPEFKLAVANSAEDNRMGMGTALQIKDSYNLFINRIPTGSNYDNLKIYRVSMINCTRNIYMSDNKTLVKLSDTLYRQPGNDVDTKYSTYINNGYNGHYTYDGVLVYENTGVSFNTGNNKVTRFEYTGSEYYKSSVTAEKPHTYQNDVPFLAYLQFPVCSDIFFESKSFKNAPTPIVYVVKTGEGGSNLAKGSMVTPANSIDLFQNKQGSADEFNPKTYTNYRTDLVSVEQYDKTLRRSNVIQDESRLNGWRTFPVEGYKNITENKGKITNIVGIGHILLVHTEHSLFMFNTDATLKTQDRDVQLLQPDAFDVQYQEVFTSDKGFGGLQDGKSWIVDQFGYIFYSVDTNRIYIFDNNSLDYIDEDIIQWLTKYKPYNVRFANDKNSNRVLIKFDYDLLTLTRHTVISYNYKVKCLVSQHPYYFDEAFNTKTKLYLKCDNSHNGCSLHNIDYESNIFGRFDNILGSLGNQVVRPSKISIIVNSDFDVVKFLEYITYKLTKYPNDKDVDFTNSPVEEYIVPFAGNIIKVYNNVTNTGELDINVNTEASKNVFGNFDKPYWDLGVWNFSHLHNGVASLSADQRSRIFGNYFIIEFTFNNADGYKIEFEELKYTVSE